MDQVSRRGLLVRAGAGTSAGVVGLLAGASSPVLAAASERDLANVRLMCSSKRLTINWYTRWLNTPRVLGESPNKDLLLRIRSQEQAHYRALAPLLGPTAPVDDDFTFTLPAGAFRTPATAARFGLALENLVLSIGIGAASTTQDPGAAESISRVVAGDAQHLAAISILTGGSAVPTGLPRAIGIEDASSQLSHFLSN